jgi:hypothetical protein
MREQIPTIDQYHHALTLIPKLKLERSEVEEALKKARKQLPDGEIDELHKRVNKALQQCVSDRLLQAGQSSATARIKWLRSNVASRRLWPDESKADVTRAATSGDPVAEAALHELHLVHVLATEEGRKPPSIDDLQGLSGRQLRELAKKAIERLSICGDIPAWWERYHDKPTGRWVRHRGDVAMERLIDNTSHLWREFVGKDPGAFGSYFTFFIDITERYADKVSKSELESNDPSISIGLRLTPRSLHSKFRRLASRRREEFREEKLAAENVLEALKKEIEEGQYPVRARAGRTLPRFGTPWPFRKKRP